jgi:hypothetical protein
MKGIAGFNRSPATVLLMFAVVSTAMRACFSGQVPDPSRYPKVRGASVDSWNRRGYRMVAGPLAAIGDPADTRTCTAGDLPSHERIEGENRPTNAAAVMNIAPARAGAVASNRSRAASGA